MIDAVITISLASAPAIANHKSVIIESSPNRGGVSGAMTVDGRQFQMGGGWSSAVPGGGVTSCFGATGTFQPDPSSPSNNYLSVCGTIENYQNSPQEMVIDGNIAPVTTGQNTSVNTTLLPTMNTDGLALDAAYAESYMVLQIGGKDGGEDNAALAGWTGPGAVKPRRPSAPMAIIRGRAYPSASRN